MNGQINVGGGENVTPEVVEQTSLLEEFAAMLITKGAVPMSASTISYDNSKSGLEATDIQSAIDEVKENITISYVDFTMLASDWNGQDYSFETYYPSNEYDIEISISKTATKEQAEAFSGAIIVGSSADNVVTALGDVPTVNIPIIIKVVKK